MSSSPGAHLWRGRRIVFQDPYTSLDPRQTAEKALSEMVRLHHGWPAERRRARVAESRVLILDESVAALDVSIQAQVVNLLADIRDQTGVSYVLISHDLAVVRQLTEQAIVMRRSRVVEHGSTAQVLDDPQHPYTRRLRASVPRPGWKPARRAGSPA